MRKNILILGHSDATQFVDIYNQYTRLFDSKLYKVTVAFLTGKDTARVRDRMIAEEVVFLDVPKKSIRGLKISAIKKLLGLCRLEQFEIVVCHRYKPSYIIMWVAQLCRIPALVFVMHELGTMSSLGRRLLIRGLAKSNMIFAGVSDAVRDDLRQALHFIPADRIITLYNVIDVALTEPGLYSREAAREKLQIPDQVFVFGNIARLVRNKNQRRLIHSFSLIKPYCPNAKLIILGDGELDATLKEQVKQYQLTNDVIFTGFVESAFRYMRAFDCFILPSTQEAFGRVLLEAMIAKVPVIAGRVNGIPEVIGDAGVLVDPKDQSMLAVEMQRLYEMPAADRQTMGENGYQRVTQNFSIPNFIYEFWQAPVLASLKDPS